MFNSKKNLGGSPSFAETVIGKGTRIAGGALSGIASVRIDGEFIGTIDIDGDLILGESGNIEGDIRARSAMVAGRARSGRIICKDSLHIVSTGNIYGDVQVCSLIVDEDAVFIGNCKMTGGEPQEQPTDYDTDGLLSYSAYEERQDFVSGLGNEMA